MKLRALLLASVGLFALAPVFAGCAVDADPAGEEGDEEVGLSQDELSRNAAKLVGAFQDKGVAAVPPSFKGFVFSADGSFFADVDSGIRPLCLPGGPCPSPTSRIEGRFTAGRKYLTLYSARGAAKTQYHGRYRYTLQGDKLSLTRSAWGDWAQSVGREHSYCKQPTDCAGQGLIHIMCAGHWTCSSQSTCGYSCGMPGPLCATHNDDADACQADASCRPIYGPSSCTPDGRICTRDFVFKGCAAR